MMNSTQDPAGRRPSTTQRQLVRDASGNVHSSEQRDDAHYSFLQVNKGSVLVTRMEIITAYKNQHGQHRSERLGNWKEPDCIALWELTHTKNGTWTNKELQDVYDKAFKEVQNKENETEGPVSSEHRSNIFQTAYKDTLQCKSSQPRGYGYMARPPSGSERIKSQFEEQARATAAIHKVNSELSHQVTELQDQLQAERESTQERINLERAERENLEERLKEDRAERERLLEEERRSRLEFEKNMMAKFAQLSQQTQTHQMNKKRTGKENSNPNLQNTLLQAASTTGTLGTRHNVIAPNTLIQAATMNSRMFRAMDPKIYLEWTLDHGQFTLRS